MKSVTLGICVLCLLALQACDGTPTAENITGLQADDPELQDFIQGVRNNLVFVHGGEFLMGDYGIEYGPEKLRYDSDSDSQPLHKVELSSYSIGKFKTTNAEYQFYLRRNGRQLRKHEYDRDGRWAATDTARHTPAHVDWYDAEKYCGWLAAISDLPFALPTEAQWEYAARSRGQFLMVATDDGSYKAEPLGKRTRDYSPRGINISTSGDREAFGKQMGWKTRYFSPLPVDMFLPNPLGLYSMSDNGYEWVKDWYDPAYYQYSPAKDPQGPVNPVHQDRFGRHTKVLRGQAHADPYWGGGVNIYRSSEDSYSRFGKKGWVTVDNNTVRCVVNSSETLSDPSPGM
jgi:formylglycine-generating enzyme required for sulfatase activity